jgi:hypothetical protein
LDHQKTDPSAKPRYCRIGPYIISIDLIHGVMAVLAEDQDSPFHIIITYADKTSICLECPSKEEKDIAMDKIAVELSAV